MDIEMSSLLALVFFLLNIDSIRAIHECDSFFLRDVFRCTKEKKLCLGSSELICREPFLASGIYDQCPDVSNQWRGLCNRLCSTVGFRINRGFKCDDGYCITNFMKWCDGKVDCPNDNADEAHCNCTARPSDCRHWATDNHRGMVSSHYVFRRVFAPLSFFVIILIVWKYYRTMKLRQRLVSLHHDARLYETDVVYVGGDAASRRNAANTTSTTAQGPPPYSSSAINDPPPYQSDPAEPQGPPSYQECLSGHHPENPELRVALPPLEGGTITLPNDLPPPPSYESVTSKREKNED